MIKVTSVYYGKVYLETDEGLDEYKRIGYTNEQLFSQHDKDGELFVMATAHPAFVRFGYQQKRADYLGNPAGYVWSSRPGCVNQAFGTDYVDCIVGSDGTLAIKASELEKILPEEYYLCKHTDERGEITYKILKGKTDEDK